MFAVVIELPVDYIRPQIHVFSGACYVAVSVALCVLFAEPSTCVFECRVVVFDAQICDTAKAFLSTGNITGTVDDVDISGVDVPNLATVETRLSVVSADKAQYIQHLKNAALLVLRIRRAVIDADWTRVRREFFCEVDGETDTRSEGEVATDIAAVLNSSVSEVLC